MPNDVVAIGDFDADGVSDLIVPGSDSSFITVLSGASASFSTNKTLPSSGTVIATGDFTGDGADDIIRQLDDLSYEVYDVSAGAAVITLPAGFFSFYTLQSVGDFNADGREDALFTDNFVGSGIIFGGADPADANALTNTIGQSVLASGDFDGDDRADILLQAANGQTGVQFSPTDGGTFSPGIAGDLTGQTLLGLGDFNGDGRDDLLLQDGSGTMTIMNDATAGATTTLSGFSGTFEAISDYNGDGRDDILVVDAATGIGTIAHGGDFSDTTSTGVISPLDLLSPINNTRVGTDMLYRGTEDQDVTYVWGVL